MSLEGPTMNHELFWISGSPYAWRVQLALGYKGVPYASHRMDSGKQANRSPAFLELNPRGKVPVLKTGDAAFVRVRSDHRFPGSRPSRRTAVRPDRAGARPHLAARE